MNKTNILTLFIFALLLTCQNTSFGQGVGMPLGSDVELADKLWIRQDSYLNFGKIARNNGGTVTITEQGTVSASGVTLLDNNQTRAEFTITQIGKPLYITSISVGSPIGKATFMGPIGTMEVTIITQPSSLPWAFGQGNPRTKTFYIGGTLNVGHSNVAGEYVGTFAINVTWNYN